jgi:ABC-type transporter Mla subunit MlaD
MRRPEPASHPIPVLVGGVTILVVIVAVFLSYNANQGLPFVPTTALKVRVPNGANLVPGNDIRSGGSRVGVIDDMRPIAAHGKVVAELDLKLDKRIGDIPSDSTFRIRPRSALGLKYLELDEGVSKKAFAERRHGAA